NSPRRPLQAAWERMRELGLKTPLDNPDFDISRFTVPDEEVTTRITIGDYLPQKLAALRCHRSQIRPDGLFLSVPEEIGREFFGYEYFTLVASRVALPPQDEGQYEEDLFAGLR